MRVGVGVRSFMSECVYKCLCVHRCVCLSLLHVCGCMFVSL